jgi:hypothetical protein
MCGTSPCSWQPRNRPPSVRDDWLPIGRFGRLSWATTCRGERGTSSGCSQARTLGGRHPTSHVVRPGLHSSPQWHPNSSIHALPTPSLLQALRGNPCLRWRNLYAGRETICRRLRLLAGSSANERPNDRHRRSPKDNGFCGFFCRGEASDTSRRQLLAANSNERCQNEGTAADWLVTVIACMPAAAKRMRTRAYPPPARRLASKS